MTVWPQNLISLIFLIHVFTTGAGLITLVYDILHNKHIHIHIYKLYLMDYDHLVSCV